MNKATYIVLAGLVTTALISCGDPPSSTKERRESPPLTAVPTAMPANPDPSVDQDSPPIDCPLHGQHGQHGQGHGEHRRPFDDPATYAEFLDRPERAQWQKPSEVVKALNLEGNETVVDLGAGSGYFSFALAQSLPRGQVIASDPDQGMVQRLEAKVKEHRSANVVPRLVRPDDPGVPQETDLVLMVDVLHHVDGQEAWLKKLASQLRPGARFAVIEFKEGALPAGPPPEMKIPKAKLLEMITAAGFVLEREVEGLLPYQVFLVFKKP